MFQCRKLIEEVSVVFHSAATIKFDEELTKAVNLNVVAVFSIIKICKRMRKLQVNNFQCFSFLKYFYNSSSNY